MQSVVGVVGVHFVGCRVDEGGVDVDESDAVAGCDGLEKRVERSYVVLAFGVSLEHVVVWSDGQDALQIDACGGRFVADALHYAFHVGGDGVDGESCRQVVDADEEEHLGGLSCCDYAETVEHAVGGVAAYAAVLGVNVAQQLRPFASVGDAVAEEYDVVGACREGFEEGGTLVVECGMLAFLCLHGA